MSVEKIENMSHWMVEATEPRQYANGNPYNANVTFEVVASDLPRVVEIITEAHPRATVHVIRKTSRFRSILIDRVGEPS